MKRRTGIKVAAIAAAGALLLSACSTSTTGGGGGGEDGGVLTVGTTDKVTVLDPAGAYDNGTSLVEQQVYPFLLAYKPGTAELNPSIAESADFTDPKKYEVKLKDGLKFANGNELTSSDVKFSFDRQIKIQDPNGPSSLLGGLESVETPDDKTVVFNLKRDNDQTWPGVLASAAGPIVDEDVFSPTELTPDQEIVDGKAFSGPYVIDGFKFNELITYKAYPDYQGYLEPAKTDTVQMKYYSDANNMKLDVEKGTIDVAWRSLSATDIEDLGKNDDLTVHKGPGGEIRYIVYNMDTMPFGKKTDDTDEKKALAVRQAMADSIDRQAVASQVYKDTYTPLYSYVPEGLPGANESLKSAYGDGKGGADVEKAKKTLEDAGVTTPVELNLQYNPDHYGPSSGDEYALIKDQLDKTGLFKVNLQSTEWVQYSEDRTADVYPMYQLGWFPDYSDADNYLVPFFYDTDETPSFLANHYRNEEINKELTDQASIADKGERAKAIEDIQNQLAEELPTLPLLQGNQIAVSGKDVKGVEDTLDPAFQFRLALLSK
ncbi:MULTISPECIES: ABC transporter substrate-binding protein [Brevibacterium]|uniref:Hemin-binding lipoprotein n=4 Tax=Bacteria TaxID=2 RepID=A0A161S8H1_9MICO|nr:ABC transporter substrate-binding protein [Brevibacterium casei]NJE67863.1 peptide ABC transporter substrate-binding protein [Brevibacterium sp. LS14]SIG83915.1 D,D-dipeptide-binding periplasmic protein ddpA [Mycobacteroides abscessus subsp. abscessus]KZE21675.1 peptide ABC transporter substrate-binding protein [Brevibacterium casei]MBE4694391.1 peptide ABC transporter substrate-binding protein [Brevibacterium casei]MBY3577513.1 peptide ABC transporter substrate-binding protein [Brevibacter